MVVYFAERGRKGVWWVERVPLIPGSRRVVLGYRGAVTLYADVPNMQDDYYKFAPAEEFNEVSIVEEEASM